MLKIAICEDNSIHAERLRQVTESFITVPSEIDMYSTSQEFEEAAKKQKLPYDLVFMDIDLDGASGISLARKINLWNPATQIIYISEYLKYATEVYETEHVYFIDKAHIEEYLDKALEKALKRVEENKQQFLFFRKRQVQYSLLQNDILYMERIIRNTEIHTTQGIYDTNERLPVLMEQLSPAFALCHRSFLVNFRRVKSLGREELTMYDDTVISIGRSYYENAKRTFAKVMLRK